MRTRVSASKLGSTSTGSGPRWGTGESSSAIAARIRGGLRALAQALRPGFGNENVLMDVDTARIGNWRARINESLEASAVVVVLIGPQWLAEFAKRTEGRDEVRYEIAEAIRRGMILLPVTLGSTQLPERRFLPEDVASLTDAEAYQLGEDKYWRPTLDVLIRDLEQALASDHADAGGGEGSSHVRSPSGGNVPGDASVARAGEQAGRESEEQALRTAMEQGRRAVEEDRPERQTACRGPVRPLRFRAMTT